MIPDTRGSFDVKEIYGEVEIPLPPAAMRAT